MKIGKILEWFYYFGMIVLIIGLVLKLNNIPQSLYIYGAGVIPILVVRIYSIVTGNPENRRKNLIFGMSAVFLASAAVAMYFNRSWWIVPIAIAATIDLYMSFRMRI